MYLGIIGMDLVDLFREAGNEVVEDEGLLSISPRLVSKAKN